jgi:hypothetical protein
VKPSLAIDRSAPERTGYHAEPTAGAAWDGGRVASVDFDYPHDEAEQVEPEPQLPLAGIMDVFLIAADDDREIAARVKLLGYILKSEAAPQTLRELGASLGMSKQGAAKRLTAFRRKCSKILS